LSEDSYKELLKIMANQIKETNTFIEKNKLNNRSYKGGKRVNIIHALTGLKQFSLAVIFTFFVLISGNFNQIFADGLNPLDVDKSELGRPMRPIILSQRGGAGPGGTNPYGGGAYYSNRSTNGSGSGPLNTRGNRGKRSTSSSDGLNWLTRHFTSQDMPQDHAQN